MSECERVLIRDLNIFIDAMADAVTTIEALVDQQAMPDDFYVSDLAYFRALSKSPHYKEEEEKS